MILERGALLNNRYRIVEILGQGGMGSVYRAVDENLGVEVAVKDNLFTTEEYARQFRREAVILANLRHPNLPRVTDHFVMEGQGQYLVMDFIEGEDLRQRMDRVGTLDEDEVIVIGVAVCEALTFLDTRRPSIVHRDIKPGNVKITPQGHIYLVDFGLAKTIQSGQATTTGARAMTPGYSPPEQYGTARTDHRSDIYSLGATLYAALTGAIPEDALARAMSQVELTPVRKHNPRISRRLSTVIEKSVAVRPDDRYQTAEEFKQALLSARSTSRRRADLVVVPPPMEEKAVPGDESLPPLVGVYPSPGKGNNSASLFPVSTPIDELGEHLPAPQKARRSVLGCIAPLLLAAVLLIGGGFAAYQYDPILIRGVFNPVLAWLPGLLPPTLTPAPTEELDPNSTLAETGSLTPAGVYVFPTSTPRLTATPPFASIPDTKTPTLAPTPTVEPPTPTAEPTPLGGAAGQIAFASIRNGPMPQIYVINIDGTGLRQVTNQEDGACQPDWSPDGTRLVFISPCDSNHAGDFYQDSALFLINADGTGMTPLTAAYSGSYDPAWSPDGTRIAYTSLRNGGRPEIYIYSLADNSVKSLSELYSRDMQPAWSPDGKKIVFISTRRQSAEIWIMNPDGSEQQPFLTSQDMTNSHPTFSPDGKLILFTQRLADKGIPHLVISPYPEQVETTREFGLSSVVMPMREGNFSPDGFWIVFEGWEAGSSHNIYRMAANGAGSKVITSGSHANFDAIWKPVP